MLLFIRSDAAVPYRVPPGRTVTFVNNDPANAVYFDTDPQRLMTWSPPSAAPQGTPLAAAGGQLQWTDYRVPVWFRANVAAGTFIEVQS